MFILMLLLLPCPLWASVLVMLHEPLAHVQVDVRDEEEEEEEAFAERMKKSIIILYESFSSRCPRPDC